MDRRPSVTFEKVPGRFTAELMQWSAMATRLPGASVELRSGLAAPLTLHLTGVTITSARIIAGPAPAALGESRLALEESLAQLGSDAQDADRELSALEALGRKKMAAGQELERARQRAALVQRRLEIARARSRLLDERIRAQPTVQERVTLSFEGMDVEPGTPGDRVSWRLPKDDRARSRPRP